MNLHIPRLMTNALAMTLTRNSFVTQVCSKEQPSCVFFLTTLSFGGSQFLELQQSVDLLIHDEAAESSAVDKFIMVDNMRVTHESHRLFYRAIGHHRQFPALSIVRYMMKRVEKSLKFGNDRLAASLFHRISDNNR